jgi:hypothetical protein
VLKQHSFWNSILPIFNKYYLCLNENFSASEIERDRQSLRELSRENFALEDFYKSVNSVSFGSGIIGYLGHLSKNPYVRPLRFSEPSTAHGGKLDKER